MLPENLAGSLWPWTEPVPSRHRGPQHRYQIWGPLETKWLILEEGWRLELPQIGGT